MNNVIVDERSFFDKLFPHPVVQITRGKIEESGSGHTLANGKHTRERWVKVKDRIFIGADETLYQASYGDEVSIASDIFGRVIGYKNHTSGMHSEASSTSAIGAISLAVLLTAVGYFGGIWNFIWKGFDLWWLTILIITFFSLYALVWTPMYVVKELRRQKLAHEQLKM